MRDNGTVEDGSFEHVGIGSLEPERCASLAMRVVQDPCEPVEDKARVLLVPIAPDVVEMVDEGVLSSAGLGFATTLAIVAGVVSETSGKGRRRRRRRRRRK